MTLFLQYDKNINSATYTQINDYIFKIMLKQYKRIENNSNSLESPPPYSFSVCPPLAQYPRVVTQTRPIKGGVFLSL